MVNSCDDCGRKTARWNVAERKWIPRMLDSAYEQTDNMQICPITFPPTLVYHATAVLALESEYKAG